MITVSFKNDTNRFQTATLFKTLTHGKLPLPEIMVHSKVKVTGSTNYASLQKKWASFGLISNMVVTKADFLTMDIVREDADHNLDSVRLLDTTASKKKEYAIQEKSILAHDAYTAIEINGIKPGGEVEFSFNLVAAPTKKAAVKKAAKKVAKNK